MTVVITGASKGIGKAVAEIDVADRRIGWTADLHAQTIGRGWATAREPQPGKRDKAGQ